MLRHAPSLLMALTLAACGGGGGDDAASADHAEADPAADVPAAKAPQRARSQGLATAAADVPAAKASQRAGSQGLATAAADALPEPTPDADVVGMWTPLADWPFLAVHASVLPNGKVLTYGTQSNDSDQTALFFDEWDPEQGLTEAAHVQVPSPTEVDSFCSASVLGPDGMLLIVGGNTHWQTSQWDPARRELLIRASQMHQPRWYGTLVTLPDQRVLVVGGKSYKVDPVQYADTPEVFSPSEGWRPLTGASSPTAFGETDHRWWYPHAYVAPDGRVFGVSNDQMWRLDPRGEGKLEMLGPTGHRLGVSGSSVMYRPGKVLLLGGGETYFDRTPATRQATIVDLTGETPTVTAAALQTRGRNYGTSLMLPTGDVLVTGGTGFGNSARGSVRPPEMWNPDTNTWRTLAPAAETRLYHSNALLLPSGAVLDTSGGAPGPVFAKNAQIYYPPYFFRKNSEGVVEWASRPAIEYVTRRFTYDRDLNAVLKLADGRRIGSVALISVGSMTHSHGTDLRYMPVPFRQSGRRLQLQLGGMTPTNLPPGHYQLHVVDARGVPSPAAIVEFRPDGSRLAAAGRASQSRTERREQSADVAVDGTFETASRIEGREPWWRLDFREPRALAGIGLFEGDEDCGDDGPCPSLFEGVTVTVLDERGEPVWRSETVSGEAPAVLGRLQFDLTRQDGNAVIGRSIVVQAGAGKAGAAHWPWPWPGRDHDRPALRLAEVQVEGGPLNLALKRPAKQSATAHDAAAALAVDGRLDATWKSGRVTLTPNSPQPWWEVDLESVQKLKQVRLWNRVDPCCKDTLADFEVLVSDHPFGEGPLEVERQRPGVRSYHVVSLEGRRALELPLDPGQTGRYLRVWLRGSGALSLAEVQVMGAR
ncbi:hypothetical protein AAW51_2416 [Caldimonas brevitalea]|uniref:F5/8 type C domain-containing protein n=1 Tax=Caldimonas brevitalea TaxID=413882 RepID=A0A0G3BIB5_9BURK|nr:hypothetical protein AAW51_2416 [Caldimonas brevitalea]